MNTPPVHQFVLNAFLFLSSQCRATNMCCCCRRILQMFCVWFLFYLVNSVHSGVLLQTCVRVLARHFHLFNLSFPPPLHGAQPGEIRGCLRACDLNANHLEVKGLVYTVTNGQCCVPVATGLQTAPKFLRGVGVVNDRKGVSFSLFRCWCTATARNRPPPKTRLRLSIRISMLWCPPSLREGVLGTACVCVCVRHNAPPVWAPNRTSIVE